MAEADPEPTVSGAGQRLGAPETLGISTLDPGHRPPAMPPGRHVTIRVRMLDDTEELFDISKKAPGKMLLDLVCSHMNLIEGDYFGLEFQNHQKMMVWLDHIKPIIKQLRRPKHTTLRFAVKFFPPDHAQLLEELTRYLFALQIKQDLSCGRLTCNDTSAALLVSHIIQSEIGDFEESQCRSHLLNNSYIPDQMPLIDKIMEFHSKHIGQTPAESDYHLLEVARRLEMYGIRLHPAKDREGSSLSLTVAHTGVLVFQGHTKINAFNWSKVRKLSFKRKRFLIKLRPDLNSSYQDTLEFLMASRDCCKVFWKICVEYHAFFRLFEEPKPKRKPVLMSRGSSFRFSGRTQKQVIDYVRESEFKKIPFERKHSRVQYNTRVQHNSRLSPLPSPRHHEVPDLGALGERVDSPHRHWKDSVVVSAEDPAVSRITRASPYHQRNGHEERSVPRPSDETRSPARPTNMDAPNIGLPSRTTRSRGTYIPFSDCIDFDYNISARSHQSFMEQSAPRYQESCLGRMCYRESCTRVNNEFYQRIEGINSTIVMSDRRDFSSPVTLPLTKAANQSRPVNPNSIQNGYSPTSSFNCTDGRFSTAPNRQSRSHKAHNNFPNQESHPSVSRAERLAALERRMMANGLTAPGRGRPRHRRLRQARTNHMGVVLINDSSPTSASESSESENSGSPVMCRNFVQSSSYSNIPKSKFSFGSLQLDEEADEDICQADDDFSF